MGKILALLFIMLITGTSVYTYLYLNQKIVVGERKLNAGQTAYQRGQQALQAGRAKYAAGQRELARGKQKYNNARAMTLPMQALSAFVPETQMLVGHVQNQIAVGGQKIRSGERQLAGGAKQIQAGQQKLAAGRAQLESGKKELTKAKETRRGIGMVTLVFLLLSVLLIFSWKNTLENASYFKKHRSFTPGKI